MQRRFEWRMKERRRISVRTVFDGEWLEEVNEHQHLRRMIISRNMILLDWCQIHGIIKLIFANSQQLQLSFSAHRQEPALQLPWLPSPACIVQGKQARAAIKPCMKESATCAKSQPELRSWWCDLGWILKTHFNSQPCLDTWYSYQTTWNQTGKCQMPSP